MFFMSTAQEKDLYTVQIKKYATNTVFRGVKFVNTSRMMRMIMKRVSEHYKVPPEHQDAWELMFVKDVKYAINNKRNSVAQDMKKSLLGKLFFWI